MLGETILGKTIGTGFLVTPDLVLTNRQVLSGIADYQTDLGFPDPQLVVMFVYAVAKGQWANQWCRFKGYGSLTAVHEHDIGFIRLHDIGFIRLREDMVVDPSQCQPVAIRDASPIDVAEPVGVCGYAYGSHLLHPGGGLIGLDPYCTPGTCQH